MNCVKEHPNKVDEGEVMEEVSRNMARKGASEQQIKHQIEIRKDEQTVLESKCGNANFRICFDGAFRKDAQASAGIAIFSYMQGVRKLLLIAGRPLGKFPNSFASELSALECSLRQFREL